MELSTFGVWSMIIALITTLSDGVTSYSYTGERSIRQSVLNSVTHDRMARPADLTNATVGFTLLVINDLNIVSQEFEISGWFTVLWEDTRLTWEPKNHDDTNYIHALEEEIWKPEVLIANAQSNIGLISDDHLIYRIDYTGQVEWEPVVLSVTHCAIDVTYYPFDTQTCTMKLLSWGLPSEELSLLKLWDEVNMQSFLGSGVWSVLETSVTNSMVFETVRNVTESYSQLEFTFVVRRNPGSYVSNTLFPIVLSSFVMVFVNLVPIESGERLTSAFLALVMDAILLMTFTSHIPDIETTTSLLGIYVTYGFCQDVFWIVTSIILARIHNQPVEKPVPRLVQTITRVLKSATLYSDPPFTPEEPERVVSTFVPTDDLVKVSRESNYEDPTRMERPSSLRRNMINPEVFTEHVQSKATSLPPISNGLTKQKTVDKLDALSDKLVSSAPIGRDHFMSWVIVASVIDRLLFVIFFIGKVCFNGIFIAKITGN